MKNPYVGKYAGRNILITLALIVLGVWAFSIIPLGASPGLCNTGSSPIQGLFGNGNQFTLQPGECRGFDSGSVIEGRAFCSGSNYYIGSNLVSSYVWTDPNTFVYFKNAVCGGVESSYPYKICESNYPKVNQLQCAGSVGTTTTQAVTTTLSGSLGACKPEDYDSDKNCIIDTTEYNRVSDLDLACSGSQCADFHQNCYLKILGAYSYHLNPSQGSPPTVRYSPCSFGSVLDCTTATGYDVDKNCQIQTAEYNKAAADKNNGIITTNCYNIVKAGYENWALRSQAYLGCTFSGCTDSQLWAFDANHDNKISISELDMCQASSVLCYSRCVLEYNKNLVTTTLPTGVTTTTLKDNNNNGWNLTNQQIGIIIISLVFLVLAVYYSGLGKKLKKK
jgi:hypothetical protein